MEAADVYRQELREHYDSRTSTSKAEERRRLCVSDPLCFSCDSTSLLFAASSSHFFFPAVTTGEDNAEELSKLRDEMSAYRTKLMRVESEHASVTYEVRVRPAPWSCIVRRCLEEGLSPTVLFLHLLPRAAHLFLASCTVYPTAQLVQGARHVSGEHAGARAG